MKEEQSMQPDWYFDETKQVGVNYTDPKIAEEYVQEHTKFRNFVKEADEISKKLGLTPDSVLLDFACGPGNLSLPLARLCKKIIAVDVSPAMREILTQRAKAEEITNIEVREGGFLSYRHEGGPVDFIISKFALHHLPDFWKSVALLNIYKILKPGGKLYLCDVIYAFPPQEHESRIPAFIKNIGDLAGRSMGEETRVHVKDEFSTYDWILEGILERAGFIIEEKKEEGFETISYLCSKK